MIDARQSKITLRKKLQDHRSLISQEQQNHTSKLICQQLYQLPSFRRAQNVALYWPFRGEVDVTNLFNDPEKTWYLPIISDSLRPWESMRLIFQPKIADDPGITNQYGIHEPTPDKKLEFNPYMLDIVLLPLLGFDQKGRRLGMGKGYYDRTFKAGWRRPKLIGLAHGVQECENLIQDDWDVDLDLIVTEKEWIDCKKGNSGL
ncbi:MAG: 5-formyltetrahydrofolate cyclo-ligase [Candidatus Azotimanducaceae bacterium]|jgi:5-formyltetrahydrofolate cyclo-ligase